MGKGRRGREGKEGCSRKKPFQQLSPLQDSTGRRSTNHSPTPSCLLQRCYTCYTCSLPT
jgi:hypothetical protein